MDTVDYVRAVFRAWWVVLLCVILGVAGGAYRNHSTVPVYSSQVTFYVGTPTDSTSAFNDDQFAQSRANSYAVLLSSERVAQLVIATARLGLTPTQVMGKIHASVPLNTVLVTATVDDTSAAQALQITTALAKQFGPLVASLDNTGKTPTVNLSVISGPLVGASPIAPRTKVNLALGLLAGLVVGILFAVLLDFRRRSRNAHRHDRATREEARSADPRPLQGSGSRT